jgi:hypothetical protein
LLNYSDDRFGRRGGFFEENQKKHNDAIIKNQNYGITHIKSWSVKDFQDTLVYKKNKGFFDKDRYDNGAAWKPWIVLDLFKKLNYGDIILYHDCNPYYLIYPIHSLIKLCDIKGHIIHQWGDKQRNWAKRDAFVYMDCDNRKQHDAVAIQNTWFLLKKTKFNVQLVEEWFKYNMDERIASYRLNSTCGKKELKGFAENRGDQTIMSILCHKYGLKTFKGIGGVKNRNLNNFNSWLSLLLLKKQVLNKG